MTSIRNDIQEEALSWFVRLQDDGLGEADWLAFRDWLEARPEHGEAYAEVEAVWVDLDEAAPSDGKVVPMPSRPRNIRRGRAAAWIAAATAIAAAAVMAIWIPYSAEIPVQTYQTSAGEMRTVSLADGSHIYLNGGSKISVRMGRRERAVTLAEGEAAFDVAHNPNQPFVIAAGDRTVRVLGTEFNVLRHAGQLKVTVRRGTVAVGPKDRAPEARLVAGQQLEHREGAAEIKVRAVDPGDAFAWRQGLLIYRDRPLTEVAHDLSRYFAKPVYVEPNARHVRFTGTLRIDREDLMLRRLETFLPVTATRTPTETHLSARGAN